MFDMLLRRNLLASRSFTTAEEWPLLFLELLLRRMLTLAISLYSADVGSSCARRSKHDMVSLKASEDWNTSRAACEALILLDTASREIRDISIRARAATRIVPVSVDISTALRNPPTLASHALALLPRATSRKPLQRAETDLTPLCIVASFSSCLQVKCSLPISLSATLGSRSFSLLLMASLK